jgi:hypothetical protein
MMKTKVIIIAAGEGTRWNNYLGVPKHLVKIDGETLLERTVRLFNGCDITIVGHDERYEVDGAELVIPEMRGLHDVNKQCLLTRDLWNKDGRTIIVLGDIFFSEKCVESILGYLGDDMRVFGRKGRGSVNKCKWGELFAHTFLTQHHDEYANAYLEAGKITKPDGRRNDWWEHYRILDGIDPMVEDFGERFVQIDDWTDDFDLPENYVIFMKYYNER